MNEVIEKEDIKIENMIYEVRGVEIIFDSDLAKLYNVETKRINEAIKNNPKKFPERYAFRVEEKEYLFLKSKISTSKGGSRKGHTAFTEQGVAMLSTILKSNTAIEVSIKIIDTFVAMRHYLIENKDIYKSLNNINNRLNNQESKLKEHNDKFELLFSKFNRKEQLFLSGQAFDAYVNILEILKETQEEIIVVDAYADITFLELISHIKCNIILITRNSNRLSDIEIEKYNKQYNNLKVIRNNSYHDRYFIIDNKEIYLCGSSINSLGDKTSMIIKLEDDVIKKTLIENIKNICINS